MDLRHSAAAVLSAAGQTGAHDQVERAGALIGHDMLEEAATAIAGPWLEDGGRVLCQADDDWPLGLSALGMAAPCALWVRGEVPVDPRTMVSVVGSRRCSDYGVAAAGQLAAAVVATGRLVVSGGARGIDSAAHAGALRAAGSTVLVAAGGAGRVYPPEHSDLFSAAMHRGAVVWEHPPGVGLTRGSFLHRNRLIAALTLATVVVEAADRSGALNTARTAADLGRLVLAVPGRMDSPTVVGVHRAVADGWAALLLSADDLVQMLGTPPESG